jgi:hypothetical protein
MARAAAMHASMKVLRHFKMRHRAGGGGLRFWIRRVRLDRSSPVDRLRKHSHDRQPMPAWLTRPQTIRWLAEVGLKECPGSGAGGSG